MEKRNQAQEIENLFSSNPVVAAKIEDLGIEEYVESLGGTVDCHPEYDGAECWLADGSLIVSSAGTWGEACTECEKWYHGPEGETCECE